MKKEELPRNVLCEYAKHADCIDGSTELTDPGHANAGTWLCDIGNGLEISKM